MVDVVPVESWPTTEANIDFYPLNTRDLEWLRQCRTQIAEVSHIITFITNYIFSDQIIVHKELPVSKSLNWRGVGARVLEMLLVYGFAFVSFDEKYREFRIWEPCELEIIWKKTTTGFFQFKARVIDIRNPMGAEQPLLIALVYQYPELGRPMSTLTSMRTLLEIINPAILAGFIATVRGANPNVFVQTDSSNQLDVAGRDLFQQQEQERLLREAEEEAHRREVMFVQKTHAAQSMSNQAVVAALQMGADPSAGPTLGEVAARVMQGSVKVPWMIMPQNMTVAKGPEAHTDTKFIEMLQQRARYTIAESFGVPASIFDTSTKYVGQSVAGIAYNTFETTIDHYTNLILSSVDKMVEHLLAAETAPTPKEEKRGQKRKQTNDHVIQIIRRRPLEQVLLLKTELSRKGYIRMLAAATNMEEEDFDPVDRELELQKLGVKDTEPQVAGKLGTASLSKLN